MTDARNQAVLQLHGLLQTQTAAALMRAAGQSGIVEALHQGQKNLAQLAEACSTDLQLTELVVSGLQAIGVIEKYGDDFALSQATRLLGQQNRDFGADIFDNLVQRMQQPDDRKGLTADDDRQFRYRLVGKQWVQTGAAMQAAEVLEIGSQRQGLQILELGGGAGVWGAAIGYRDDSSHITSVDDNQCLALAEDTYNSVEMTERRSTIESDYRTFEAELGKFDLAVLPEIVQLENDSDAVILLGRTADGLKVGGEVVIVEQILDEGAPAIPIRQRQLELTLATRSGRLRSAAEIERLLIGAGFESARWGWLTDSTVGLALIIAKKSSEPS